ncbi:MULTISPECIES: acyltransferase family protein [Shewanella]|uniref:acyltransferase family protein n=1 Tax=Shewanella TaxID=22 RepID=UPI001C65A68F|nr:MULTISPECIES: acyltransferase [Shewanella]QYJ75086.1 acyltransferase [Shewanella sp. FJAT-52076]QYK04958.1 acyltransferase [Shewanella zhangzhouensis]
MRKQQLEFTYMRAIAILWIVAGHSIYNSGAGFPLPLENLVRGGTALFVFISGYFYHRIFHPRMVYKEFMVSKLRNVLLPFLWVSLVGLAMLATQWSLMYDRPLSEVAKGIYYTVRNGYVLYPHWYIPFIMAVFAISPVFSAYIRMSGAARWTLLALSCVIALLIHRPIGNINVLHSVVYFTPFYLMGILYSAHEEWLKERAVPLLWLALLGTLLSLYMQTYVQGHVGNYHKEALSWGGVDWQFVQKFSLVILAVGLCLWLSQRSLSDRTQKSLNALAEMSFAIFFIHPLFSILFSVITGLLRFKLAPGNMWTSLGLSMGIFVFLLVGSVVTARAIKAKLGDRSRSYIGW